MRAQHIAILAVIGGLAGLVESTSGCGATYYAVQMTGASSRVEEAKTVHAAELAPYEYYFAREHLYQAEIEAASANYSDAAHFAEIAELYAGRAIDLAAKARNGAADSADDPGGADRGEEGAKSSKNGKSDNAESSTDHDNDSSP